MKVQATSPPSTFKVGNCRTVSHERKVWRHVEANLVRRTGLDKEETEVTAGRHLIVLNVKGRSERGEHFLDEKRADFASRKPGAVLFIPAGCHWKGWEGGASTAAYLSISVEPSFVTDVFSRMTSRALPALSPDLCCEDAIIMNAARGIGEEINDRNPLSAMLVESYVATMFAQLFRRQKYEPPVQKGGLAGVTLRRVIEKINDDLTADLSLGELASIAGLSIPHFCRAFKQTLGCAPHAFIVQRKVERAKEYLRLSTMSVTDVALLCGFSSSSHFSNTFRREAGVTPVAFRNSSLDKSFE